MGRRKPVEPSQPSDSGGWAGDGVQASERTRLHLTRNPGRPDDAESRTIRGVVLVPGADPESSDAFPEAFEAKGFTLRTGLQDDSVSISERKAPCGSRKRGR